MSGRYWLFLGEQQHPQGGMKDFVQAFPTLGEAATAGCVAAARPGPSGPRWWHVLDTETMQRYNSDPTPHELRTCVEHVLSTGDATGIGYLGAVYDQIRHEDGCARLAHHAAECTCVKAEVAELLAEHEWEF